MDFHPITWVEVLQHRLEPSGRNVVLDLECREPRQAEPCKGQAPSLT